MLLSQAFTRDKRLLNDNDFQSVFRQSKRFRQDAFTLLAHCKKEGQARIGFAIKKKLFKRAVKRNRFRRLVRESFRVNETIKSCPVDIVIMVNAGADKLSNQQLFEQLQILWTDIIQFSNSR